MDADCLILDHGALSRAGAILHTEVGCGDAAIVTDDCVAPLYADQLEKSLRDARIRPHRFVFPAGETGKSPAVYLRLLTFLAEENLTRADTVISLGGGVAGDLAGFAAATYLRGIALVHIPTTLLAAVDAAIGGKNGINLPEGKNLVGTFYRPAFVLCDPDCLRTLPDAVFSDGCAEILKYGLLCRSELLQFQGTEEILPVIRTCVDIKMSYVREDYKDCGRRRFLNLGHTAAHAVERLSGWTISHGSAVAAGLCIITRAAELAGDCLPGTAQQVEQAVRRFALPTGTSFSASAVTEALRTDKKRTAERLTLVIPQRVGDCMLRELPFADAAAYLTAGLSEVERL